jgi:ribose transport system substrate-binding protein
MVAVINCGSQEALCNTTTDAIVSAVKVLGWKYKLYDANLNVAGGDETSIAAAAAVHPDAIIMSVLGCTAGRPAMIVAHENGIPMISITADDCSDLGEGPALEVPLLYNSDITTAAQWWFSIGKQGAEYIIAASGGHAKVLVAELTGGGELYAENNGFNSVIRTCSGCQVLNTISVTPMTMTTLFEPDLKAQLVKYGSEATYVWISVDGLAIPPSGGAQAFEESGSHAKLVTAGGSEGVFTYVKSGLITAEVGVTDTTWLGWAAVDEMVRHLAGLPPVPEGLGIVTVDPQHNLPSGANYTASVDFKSVYEKDWGVGS